MMDRSAYLEEVIKGAKAVDPEQLSLFIDALESAYRESRAVFVIGNGGSAANASHFAQDLAKGTMVDVERQTPFKVMSLTDNVSAMTALANDIGYDRVFDLPLRQHAVSGDLLVAISGSGNSPNIVRAAAFAREAGIRVAGVTGFDGGQLMPLSDIKVHVPLMDMCKSEAVHAILFHLVADELRERFSDGDTA